MAKKLDFRRLSDKRCVVCKTRLKQNLVNRNPEANMCYKHYQQIIRKQSHGVRIEPDYKARLYMKGVRT